MVFKYLLIIVGLIILTFSRDIADVYENFTLNNGSHFPRFITNTRLIVGGLVMIAWGVYQLIEQV